MKFGRSKSESDDGSSTASTSRDSASPATPPPTNREPRESIAPKDTAAAKTPTPDPQGPAAERAVAPARSGASGPVTDRSTTDGTAPATTKPDATAPRDTAPEAPAQQDEAARKRSGLTEKNKVRRTRVSGLWIGIVIAAILAVFLLIFIAQNSEDVTIKFLTWEGDVPLAVAMLAGAVVAVLIVAVPGSLRIAQLRRALRKNAKREDRASH